MKNQPPPSLPLTEPTLYILLSLAQGQKHGYAVMKDVEALSEGRVRLSTSTLYGALSRLLDQAWIERAPDEDTDKLPNAGRPHKAYRLTHNGRRALEAETNRMQALVDASRQGLAKGQP